MCFKKERLTRLLISISLFNSRKREKVITCWWTPSSRSSNTGRLWNAELEYLLLYLNGSLDGSEHRGKEVQLCMHRHNRRICWQQSSARNASSHTTKPRASSIQPAAGHGPAEPWDWSASWIFNKSALWHALCRNHITERSVWTHNSLHVSAERWNINQVSSRAGGRTRSSSSRDSLNRLFRKHLYWFTITDSLWIQLKECDCGI